MESSALNNEHLILWKKYIEESLKYFENGDMSNFQKYKELSDEEYSSYKEESEMSKQMESITFGFANYIVENNVAKFLKRKDKKSLNEYTKLIKEDKNLSNQFKLVTSLLNNNIVNDDEGLMNYIKESISFIENKINRKTLEESNNKLLKFIESHSLILKEDISDDLYELFEDIDFLLKNKKNLSNIHERNKRINSIFSIISENNKNKNSINESSEKNDNITLDEFEEKYSNKLNEDELSLIKNIIESDQGKKEAFDDYKTYCHDKISGMIKECNDTDTLSQLNEIKEKISNMSYDSNNVYNSIIQLIDINDILSE